MSSKKSSSRVEVHSKLTVVSSKPSGPVKTHPLSVLDHAMALHTLHIIFYYEDNLFQSFDLNPLRESLAEVLSIYPSVTGRLSRADNGNWEVNCNDAGVRIFRAKVGVSLHEWLSSADESEERDLTVWDDMPEDPTIWSSFRLQINEFEGGGVAIGLSCPHMLADPTSATLLFKSWAETYRRETIEHPPFFNSMALHGRPIPNVNTKSAEYYATKSKAQASSLKMASATFKFPTSVIKQCLSEVHQDCPDATPFDFLAAFFWTRITRVKGHKNIGSAHSLSICTDFRRLLQGSLPFGYFGNALHFSMLSLEGGEMGQGKLGHVVQSVHSHMLGMEEEEVWSVIDWFEAQKVEGGKFAPPFRMFGPELTCISFEHMIVPSTMAESSARSSSIHAMFDKDRKPIHASYHVGNVEGEGLIVVTPSTEEGFTRTVTVTLPEKELAELCEDQSILRLEPTMLLCGKI
ncbi:hypothetical protein I3843_07G063900 [Carya illinoinensis]|nr:hypothetical protein I3843_07G063900 [Carya illinoinensis]